MCRDRTDLNSLDLCRAYGRLKCLVGFRIIQLDFHGMIGMLSHIFYVEPLTPWILLFKVAVERVALLQAPLFRRTLREPGVEVAGVFLLGKCHRSLRVSNRVQNPVPFFQMVWSLNSCGILWAVVSVSENGPSLQ